MTSVEMRDPTRYQTKLTTERSREKQRLLKVLEAAGIKLGVVGSGRDRPAAGHQVYAIDPLQVARYRGTARGVRGQERRR